MGLIIFWKTGGRISKGIALGKLGLIYINELQLKLQQFTAILVSLRISKTIQ